MNQFDNKYNNKLTLILMYITICFSILSQINIPQLSIIFKSLMYFGWIVLLFNLLYRLNNNIKINLFGKTFLLNYFIFLVVIMVASISGSNHLNAGILMPLTISLITYFIGTFLHQLNFTYEYLSKVLIVFVGCVLLLALQIQIEYFPSVTTWLSQESYAYTKKNSAGIIFGLTIIILLYCLKANSKKKNILRYVAIVYLCFILLLIQSRAAIISLSIACIARALFVKKDRRKYIFTIILLMIIAFRNDQLMNLVNKSFLIDKYAGTNLNTFSSGRFDYWAEAWAVFLENPFLGNGSFYVDNFYINTLTETGLVGFILIATIVFFRMVENLKMTKSIFSFGNAEEYYYTIKIISVFFIVDSIFEGYPPIGPGVSTFLFWLLSGYIDADYGKYVYKKTDIF